MAININTVYQKVLALANKEQRGYITPQDFNLFADMAQMDIFEQYFYDKNQFLRTPGNNTMSSDMVELLQEKIKIFESFTPSRVEPVNNAGWVYLYDHTPERFNLLDLDKREGSDLYRIQRVQIVYEDTKIPSVAKLVDRKEDSLYTRSILSNVDSGGGTKLHPTYMLFTSTINSNRHATNRGNEVIQIKPYPQPPLRDDNNKLILNEFGLPTLPDKIQIFYIRKPKKPNWAYSVVNDVALFNSTNSQNFELHPSEENKLVIKILQLAGISLKDYGLVQASSTKENTQIQQEKS
tara:strand:+ start:13 stop:894 length:882 start_codon:yes stop_codon:yes gene_type:complete